MLNSPTIAYNTANRSASGIIYTIKDLLELILNKGFTVRATGKILGISASTVSTPYNKPIKGQISIETPIHKPK